LLEGRAPQRRLGTVPIDYFRSKFSPVLPIELRPCAHAIPNPVPRRRPSPSHLSIPFFPFRFRLQVTKSIAP